MTTSTLNTLNSFNTMTLNTLQIVETLKESGMPEPQAKAISSILLITHESAELMTRPYYHSEQEKSQIRIDAKFAEMDAKFEARFAEMDTKFEARFAAMDAKFEVRFEKMDAKIDKLTLQMTIRLGGIMIAGMTVLAATVTAIVKIL